MRPCHFSVEAVVIGLLLINVNFAFADEIELPPSPPPPVYKPVGAQPALITLRDLKVTWLKAKKAEQDKQIKSFERKKNMENEDKEAYEKAIKKYKEASVPDENDINALSGKNALDPSKDSAFGEHAKLIKKNVEAWINTLDAKHDAAARKDPPDVKEVKRTADEAKALRDGLNEAEKSSKKLFE
jgi:hypothetical protein